MPLAIGNTPQSAAPPTGRRQRLTDLATAGALWYSVGAIVADCILQADRAARPETTVTRRGGRRARLEIGAAIGATLATLAARAAWASVAADEYNAGYITGRADGARYSAYLGQLARHHAD